MFDEHVDIGAVTEAVAEGKRLLNRGRINRAIKLLEAQRQKTPEHRDLLYLLAVCYRFGNNATMAQSLLDCLLKRYPKYARAYQEFGHLHRTQDKMVQAINNYEQAVRLNPALLASWQNLSKLYQSAGETSHQRECDEQCKALKKLAPQLLSATSIMYEGKLHQAEQLCRTYLQQYPRDVAAMRLLAKIASDLEILDDADFLLESSVEFEPENLSARLEYTQVLFKRQRYEKSHQQAAQLLRCQPENPAFRLAYANAAVPVGDIENALSHYHSLTDEFPDNIQFHMLKGHAFKTSGIHENAVAAYREATRLKPDFGDAYWSLANLKTYQFSADEIAVMKRYEEHADTSVQDRYQLCFALGKSYEDAEQASTAFRYYERGNRLKREQSGYNADKTDREFARIRKVCSEAFFTDRVGYGTDAADPIFIVGMPRSGSTLLEQILASHPMIEGTIELPDVMSTARKLAGRFTQNGLSRYPGVLQELSSERFAQLGKQYLESTRVYRNGARHFTDKMPNNFLHIGLIHLMLPNAKIIDARRESMACCFSNFKQLFGRGQEFSYGLEEVGRYYREYEALMAHWDRVLAGKILRVHYEDVVNDLEHQVRRILEYLNLPFDPRCISFFNNERAVHTPSAEQVRQPIFDTALQQWKKFEAHLQPLNDILGSQQHARQVMQ